MVFLKARGQSERTRHRPRATGASFFIGIRDAVADAAFWLMKFNEWMEMLRSLITEREVKQNKKTRRESAKWRNWCFGSRKLEITWTPYPGNIGNTTDPTALLIGKLHQRKVQVKSMKAQVPFFPLYAQIYLFWNFFPFRWLCVCVLHGQHQWDLIERLDESLWFASVSAGRIPGPL